MPHLPLCSRATSLRQELSEIAQGESQNLTIEYRWAEGRNDLLESSWGGRLDFDFDVAEIAHGNEGSVLARRRTKSGLAGGYLLGLLRICIRRSRRWRRLSTTIGRTVRMRCKAALRHRVRYVIAIRRFLADAARN